MRRKLLLVEDTPELNDIIAIYLEEEGFAVHCAYSIEDTVQAMSKEAFDLIILDINLPDGDGLNFLEDLRKISSVPVIFASARTSETDRILGFQRGGDDYLPKPFSLEELSLRIRALLRRTYGREQGEIRCGHLRLSENTSSVYVDDKERALSPKEYTLLRYFMENPNRILGKELLMDAVWGTYTEVESSTLAVHIRWLREKIERDPANPEILKTVWAKGYKFVCEEESH
ncbi:MAG: response regulator transcription factor [Saccharofermentanales bacterium]|jgi:DNA-binding response OmpR family regulator